MSSGHDSRRFDMSLDIDAPTDAVWRALSEARELTRWFAPEAEVKPGLGGSVRWTWPDLHDWVQVVDVWEPGKHLRTRYDSPVDDGKGGKLPLFMDFFIEGRGAKTTLRMVHSGFGPEDSFDQEYDGISRGWPVELRSLKLYLEFHVGRDRRVAWTKQSLSEPLESAWQRLIGQDGLRIGSHIESLAEGQAFAIEIPGAGGFDGQVLLNREREFCGIVENHGQSFLRVCVEQCGDQPVAWLWLATYDQPESFVSDTQDAFDSLCHKLFAESSSLSQAKGV